MRKLPALLLPILLVVASARAGFAQEGETWETQEPVYAVTLIKIHPNMGERYLNNLKRTWVTGVREAINEGLTLEYHIFSSLSPNDSGFNLMLVTKHPNLAAFDATDEWRRKIDRIVKRVEANISEEESDRVAQTVYPEIRTILASKLMREIKFIEQ